MSSSIHVPHLLVNDLASQSVAGVSRPLQLLLSHTTELYLLCLTAMLFRPPDLAFCCVDRIAFGALVFLWLLRCMLLHDTPTMDKPVAWPLLAMLVLATAGLLSQPFEPEAWSVLAAKWAIPFALYHIAGSVFQDSASLRKLEIFLLCILAYLILIALLFLFDAKSWIVPSFIVDDGLGIHADRARGPFLQAVANGLALNLLGLVALDAYRRRRLPWPIALTFLATLPAAILATKTRAVWLSFAASVFVLSVGSLNARVRRACLSLIVIGGLGVAAAYFSQNREASFADRLEERSPVEFRAAVYEAGWEMLQQKPAMGWGFEAMQTALTRRINRFHQREYFFHNTFLEVAVQHGLLGLGLYLWIIVDLFRVARKPGSAAPHSGVFLDREFRSLWPVLLFVYLVNACFVVMNYQFVNGLLFTLAGIFAAQNRYVDNLNHQSL
jgi:putative inorganic carbon (HCO3(-)) transporter